MGRFETLNGRKIQISVKTKGVHCTPFYYSTTLI